MKTVKINGDRLKNMFIYGIYLLNKNKDELDSLNIFPVPDGDTGTNMSLTGMAAVNELLKLNEGCRCDTVAAAVASGSLRGARGNSGVILSQLFRGLSKGFAGKDEITPADFGEALERSQKTAYKAVMKPKEGTVLTVAREAAEKAKEHLNSDFDTFFTQVLGHANIILGKTTFMLPALKAAGVVDAGAKGLLYIYQGMFEGLYKDAPTVFEVNAQPKAAYSAVAQTEEVDIKFDYCTEFFIEVKNISKNEMKDLTAYLLKSGDSVVAVEDEELVKIHVHSNNPGNIIEYALKIGPLSNIKVENMRIQHTSVISKDNGRKEEPGLIALPKADKTNKNIGVIAVSAGEGINSIFLDLGCDKVITGGQTMNPSAEDILKAAEAIDKEGIIILPNNKNIILAAKQAANILEAESGKKTVVLETKTIPEGLSAMVSMVQDLPLEETAESMWLGAECVKTGLVTEAIRDTEIDGKTIKLGDYLGLIGGQIELTADSPFNAAKLVIDKLSQDCELISIYYGEGGSEEDGQKLCGYVNQQGLEAELQYGGQPVYAYVISAE